MTDGEPGGAQNPNSDGEPEEVSAGGVVLRKLSARPEVILAEQLDWNTKARNVRLPKGHLEAGETLEEAALREVEEEVGVRARVLQRLRPVYYAFWHEGEQRRVPKVVHYFLMEHTEGVARPADGEMERTFWCRLEDAAAQLTFPSERVVVEEAQQLLASGGLPGR